MVQLKVRNYVIQSSWNVASNRAWTGLTPEEVATRGMVLGQLSGIFIFIYLNNV